jgi:hypothetical protein
VTTAIRPSRSPFAWLRLSALVAFALGLVLAPPWARVALAGPGIEATTLSSATKVEVDEQFSVSLELRSEDSVGTISSPSFDPPPGVLARGPTFGMQESTRFLNGVRTRSSISRVTYVLTASTPGKYTVKSPTVVAQGRTFSGQPITVEVVPKGSGGTSGAPPSSPFLLGPGSGFLNDPFAPRDDEDSGSASELELPNGPDDDFFLHAVVDKTDAVVGEQITYSVYLYFRVSYEMSERSDPKYADFLRFPMLPDPASTKSVYTRVAGRRYGARLIERVALIPLTAGKLHVGSMSARFKGRQIGSGVLKSSNDVVIEVSDAPAAGRPPGYQPGDVGQYALSATVTPRKVKQGGSISVSIKIEGVGNVPSAVTPPTAQGAEWLTPHRRDDISIKNGRVGGARLLDYVVRMDHAGRVDLGTLELPYYDPASKQYEVAKVALGVVDVEDVAPTADQVKRAQNSGDGEEPLAKLPSPRKKLTAFAPAQHVALPPWALWLGVGLPPLAAFLVLGLGRARRAATERKNAPTAAARAKLREALAAAKSAEKSGDAKALLGAIERAIHTAIELGTEVKSRGVRLDDLETKLVEQGVAKDLAAEAAELLRTCDALRFAPAGETDQASQLRARATKLAKKLEG